MVNMKKGGKPAQNATKSNETGTGDTGKNLAQKQSKEPAAKKEVKQDEDQGKRPKRGEKAGTVAETEAAEPEVVIGKKPNGKKRKVDEKGDDVVKEGETESKRSKVEDVPQARSDAMEVDVESSSSDGWSKKSETDSVEGKTKESSKDTQKELKDKDATGKDPKLSRKGKAEKASKNVEKLEDEPTEETKTNAAAETTSDANEEMNAEKQMVNNGTTAATTKAKGGRATKASDVTEKMETAGAAKDTAAKSTEVGDKARGKGNSEIIDQPKLASRRKTEKASKVAENLNEIVSEDSQASSLTTGKKVFKKSAENEAVNVNPGKQEGDDGEPGNANEAENSNEGVKRTLRRGRAGAKDDGKSENKNSGLEAVVDENKNTKRGAKVSKPAEGDKKNKKSDAMPTRNSKTDTKAKTAEDKKVAKTGSRKVAKNDDGDEASEAETPKKKARLSSAHSSHRTTAGIVLTVGEGDTGQLGLGPDVQERGKPGKVEMPSGVVQVYAGGMHTVCLTVDGEVFTFGCNDEGSLGRETKEEEDCMEPGKVELPEKIILVSAGDSHTAALAESGQVYIWGTFRDANGSIGIIPGKGKIEKPEKILKNIVVSKIGSGCDHLVCLTANGDIYSLGAAEQGQLGRVAECFSVRGGRKGIELLLIPSLVKCKKRNQKFADIWTGQYVTFAKARDSGDIYAWGLNNYYQLGFPDMRNKFIPEKSDSFEKSKDWKEISGGQHHTVALDKDGLVYSLGRKEYGRLGLGSELQEEKSSPTLVTSLKDKKCVNVNCGSAVSFAVDENGKIYGWGMGSSKQLGQGDDEEDIYEPKHLTAKLLDDKRGLMVSAGGQHTVFLAQNRS